MVRSLPLGEISPDYGGSNHNRPDAPYPKRRRDQSGRVRMISRKEAPWLSAIWLAS